MYMRLNKKRFHWTVHAVVFQLDDLDQPVDHRINMNG